MFATRTRVSHEMLHWLLLWMLAAVAIALMQQRVMGTHPSTPLLPPPAFEPIPPNDAPAPPIAPELENHPFGPDVHPHHLDPNRQYTLNDVLRMNREGDFGCVTKVWEKLEMRSDSRVWKHVGMGVAHLRLEELDEAERQLSKALKLDANNAIAHYFLGRVFQARSRNVPFWYESDRESPFRLAADVTQESTQPRQKRGRTLLPHFLGDEYAAKARIHFGQAVELAPLCDLNRIIHVVPDQPPAIRLAGLNGDGSMSITVGDLMLSLGERDFVERAKRALGIRVA